MATNRTPLISEPSNFTEADGISSVLENDHGEITKYAFPILLALGLAGNLISFCTMLRKEWRKKSTSVYMAALAVIDTLAMLSLFNRSISTRERKTIPGLYSMCNWSMFLFGGSITCSSWLLVAVTTDRLVAVFIPMKSRIILTAKRAAITVTALLLVCYGIYAYMLFAVEDDLLIKGCPVRPGYHNWYSTGGVFLLYSIFRGYLPAVLIIIFNVAIVIQLKRRTMIATSRDSSSASKAIKKTTIMVVVVSTAFVLLVGPGSVIITLRGFVGIKFGSVKTSNIVREISEVMGFINHAMNFYLYIGCSQQFRQSVRKMAPSTCTPVQSDPQTQSTDSGQPSRNEMEN